MWRLPYTSSSSWPAHKNSHSPSPPTRARRRRNVQNIGKEREEQNQHHDYPNWRRYILQNCFHAWHLLPHVTHFGQFLIEVLPLFQNPRREKLHIETASWGSQLAPFLPITPTLCGFRCFSCTNCCAFGIFLCSQGNPRIMQIGEMGGNGHC